ncbi:hypothetical protein Tco_0249475 [Tanacetum coccineum]
MTLTTTSKTGHNSLVRYGGSWCLGRNSSSTILGHVAHLLAAGIPYGAWSFMVQSVLVVVRSTPNISFFLIIAHRDSLSHVLPLERPLAILMAYCSGTGLEEVTFTLNVIWQIPDEPLNLIILFRNHPGTRQGQLLESSHVTNDVSPFDTQVPQLIL